MTNQRGAANAIVILAGLALLLIFGMFGYSWGASDFYVVITDLDVPNLPMIITAIAAVFYSALGIINVIFFVRQSKRVDFKINRDHMPLFTINVIYLVAVLVLFLTGYYLLQSMESFLSKLIGLSSLVSSSKIVLFDTWKIIVPLAVTFVLMILESFFQVFWWPATNRSSPVFSDLKAMKGGGDK